MWWLLQRLLASLICRSGPIPQHLAIVMDGNRRFAKQQGRAAEEGHKDGFQKLVEVLRWCLDLGIRYVSVYAFSTENFKRSQREVEALMQLAEIKYKEMIEENGFCQDTGMEVRVLGDMSMAPPNLQEAAARVMTHSAQLKNKQGVLNICFAYTSSHDMAEAAGAMQDGLSDGSLQMNDISECLLERCLCAGGDPPVDLVVRTSGETRLSDFLLWQSRCAHIHFSEALWPALSFRHFAAAILEFQRHADTREDLRNEALAYTGGNSSGNGGQVGSNHVGSSRAHEGLLSAVFNGAAASWAASLQGLLDILQEHSVKMMGKDIIRRCEADSNGNLQQNGHSEIVNGRYWVNGAVRDEVGTLGGILGKMPAPCTPGMGPESGAKNGVTRRRGKGRENGRKACDKTPVCLSHVSDSCGQREQGVDSGEGASPGLTGRAQAFIERRREQWWKWVTAKGGEEVDRTFREDGC
eukprot:evm.model.scf_841EXC.4 EVM.evm.TU.scf_841EXC.4   scf_841EXC:34987-37753(-)